MDELALTFIPVPYVIHGRRRDGLLGPWAEACGRCDRRCERDASVGHLSICTYGVNYARVDDGVLLAGFIVKDFADDSAARKKQLRRAKTNVVAKQVIESILNRAQGVAMAEREALEDRFAEVLSEYRETEQYKTDLVTLLKPSLEQAFAQVHDYRGLTSQIIQNVNVLLTRANPGKTLDEQLSLAPSAVQAIYWSARLMDLKLQSALYLVHPERIGDPDLKRVFRLHGSVRKYLGIYESVLRNRSITLRETGSSYASIMANPDAVNVIPHALVDNAIKYSPNHSELVVDWSETSESISMSVSSFGPKIDADERDHIFDLFYRGRAAVAASSDGTGFGLGLASHVASHIGAAIAVKQTEKPDGRGLHWTTFTASFPITRERPDPLRRQRMRVRGGPSGGGT